MSLATLASFTFGHVLNDSLGSPWTMAAISFVLGPIFLLTLLAAVAKSHGQIDELDFPKL